MQADFLAEYNAQIEGRNLRTFLHQANPNKFYMLEYLLEIHIKKKDKILVFIDTIEILVDYAKRLNHPYISGEVSEYE